MAQIASHEDIEAIFLATVLAHPDSFPDTLEFLEPSFFSSPTSSLIFSTLTSLYMDGKPLDIIHLSEAMGGSDDLNAIITATPAGNATAYARLVGKNYQRRRLSSELASAAKAAESGDPSQIIAKVDSVISEATAKASVDYLTTPQLTKQVLTSFAQTRSNPSSAPVVKTGYGEIDTLLGGGFRPGELVIVAARPAMGKTALAVNIAVNAASMGTPSLIFSLEMTAVSLQLRMAQVLDGIERHELDPINVSEGGLERSIRALDRVAGLPVLVNDKSAISTPQMHRVISRAVRRHEVKLVFVDYLQLARGPNPNDMREREVAEISSALKAFAKEFNVCVVAASQLNRQVEMRESKRPLMSDLRESGSIEQDADVIMFLYRDAYYNPNPHSNTGETEVIVGKHRNGPTGTVLLTFQDKYTRFVEGLSSKKATWTGGAL